MKEGYLIVIFSTIIFLLFLQVYLIRQDIEDIERIIKIDFWNDKKPRSVNNTIAGLYNPDTDIYCVWEKGVPKEKLEETDKHEFCHMLIDNGYKDHFCKCD